MTLHFSQIGLTDDLTFTVNPPFKKSPTITITYVLAIIKQFLTIFLFISPDYSAL